MQETRLYRFSGFELDVERFELRHEGARVPMEPQVFEVLAYLVTNRERLVPKQELLDYLWPERYISEAALTSRLMAARKAIGDDGTAQRLIRTVHGRGYRFVGELDGVPSEPMAGSPQPRLSTPLPPAGDLPGRGSDLVYLDAAWARALEGKRQIVFVTGEGGIGKSAVVKAFRARITPKAARFAAGQCVELSGSGEPFLPIYDALTQLLAGEEAGQSEVRALLEAHAPTWLTQLPGAFPQAPPHASASLVANQDRMLRELLEFLDALARREPVLLTLEDLHWSDQSTIQLLAAIARRPQPARLMLLGTCRPGDAGGEAVQQLKADLRVRGLCSELALGRLGPSEVAAVAAARLPGARLTPELAERLARRSGGNPLFLQSMLDHLGARAALHEGEIGLTPPVATAVDEVPVELRDLLRLQLSRLSPSHRSLLEAAAVVAPEFGPGLLRQLIDDGGDEESVEQACEELVERGPFLARTAGQSAAPGDTPPRYAFVHDLHREVVSAGLTHAKRARLHLRAGSLLEAQPTGGRRASAAELAEHFELGGDAGRAISHRRAAAAQAFARSGFVESVSHLEAALRLIESGGIEHPAEEELAIRAALAPALISVRGFGAPEAERALRRTLELARELGDREHEEGAIIGLAALLEYRGQHGDAGLLLEHFGERARASEPRTRMPYHALLSCSEFHRGRFEASFEQGRLGLAGERPQEAEARWAFFGEEPGNGCREWSAMALWFLGQPDSAVALIDDAVADARAPGRRYALASALVQAARVRQLRREPKEAELIAREAIEVAAAHGFAYHYATAVVLAGWAAAGNGSIASGLAEMERGIQLHEQTGARMDRAYFLALMAERLLEAHREKEAASLVVRALDAVDDQDFFYQAELLRLRAVVVAEADRAEILRGALAIARAQGSPALELRVTVALAGIEGSTEVRHALASLAGSFTEGLDSPDMLDAVAVLAASAASA